MCCGSSTFTEKACCGLNLQVNHVQVGENSNSNRESKVPVVSFVKPGRLGSPISINAVLKMDRSICPVVHRNQKSEEEVSFSEPKLNLVLYI